MIKINVLTNVEMVHHVLRDNSAIMVHVDSVHLERLWIQVQVTVYVQIETKK
jgi:hypothetical protein